MCVQFRVNLIYLVRSAYRLELQEGMDDLIMGGPAWVRSGAI